VRFDGKSDAVDLKRASSHRGGTLFITLQGRDNSMKIAGIILVVLGVLALAYQGIRYTTREKLIDIGPLKVTASERKTIPLPPIVGGIALAAGIALILMERKKI
jgi:drug/metabolite transporter (DMT)-like permease